MPKNKLGTAFIITLTMLVGVFYFSNNSTAINSGQAITLCLGALAWIALILTAKPQPEQANLLSTKPINSDSLPNSIAELLGTFQAELGQQISATEAELKQMKSLMDNAIDDLVDSFISLEASTRIEQKLVMLLAANETENDQDELNPFREKQLKSKQLLLETLDGLKTLIADAKQNQTAVKSLGNIESDSEKTIEALEDALSKSALSTHGELADKAREVATTMHALITKANKVVAKLNTSSKVLSQESSDISSKVSAIIEENLNNIAMVADEMAATTKQIEVDVQTAVKSLQFQDMTTQLITQCNERMHIMQEMLQAISSIDSTAAHSTESLETKLMVARNKLRQASAVRMKQFNVDAGSVELFN